MLFISFSAFGQSKKKKETKKTEPVIEQVQQDTIEKYPQDTLQLVMQFSECAMCTVHPSIVYLIVENQGTKKKPEYVKIKTLWPNGQEVDESKIYIWGSQNVKR